MQAFNIVIDYLCVGIFFFFIAKDTLLLVERRNLSTAENSFQQCHDGMSWWYVYLGRSAMINHSVSQKTVSLIWAVHGRYEHRSLYLEHLPNSNMIKSIYNTSRKPEISLGNLWTYPRKPLEKKYIIAMWTNLLAIIWICHFSLSFRPW